MRTPERELGKAWLGTLRGIGVRSKLCYGYIATMAVLSTTLRCVLYYASSDGLLVPQNFMLTMNIGTGVEAKRSLFLATAGRSSKTRSSERAGRNGRDEATAIWSTANFEGPWPSPILALNGFRLPSF